MTKHALARCVPALLLCVGAALSAPRTAAAQACGFAFEDLASLALPAPEPETRMIARDLDLDGRDEILVTYPTCPGSVWIVGSSGGGLSVVQVLGPADGLLGSPSGIDAADVDLDGDVDLIVGHLEGTACAGRGVTVFDRRADGTWGDGEFFPGDNDGRHLLALDLEGSGLPLIVTGDGPRGSNPTTGKAIQVRENEGPGDFHHAHEYGLQPAGAAVHPDLLAAGMLDGRPTGDLFVYWSSPDATAGLCNFGDSTFEEVSERRVSPRPSTEPTGAAAGDVTGDGRLDLILAYGDSEALYVHPANSDGGTGDCLVPGSGGGQCMTAAGMAELLLADLDGDAVLDIAGIVTDPGRLAFHGGSGDGSFGVVKLSPHDGRPVRLAAGALSGDPRPDFAVLDDDGLLHLLRNDSVDERCPRAIAVSQPVLRADATCTGLLPLDGSPSVDPEGGPLTYLWYQDGVLVLETDQARSELPAPIGLYSYTLVVRDAAGNESRPWGLTLNLRDGVAPVLEADPPPPVECDSPLGARVVATATATDECTAVTITSGFGSGGVVDRQFPIGSTELTWSARDGGSNITRTTVEVLVVDTTPPALDCPPVVSVDCPGTGVAEVDLVATVSDLCAGPCALSIRNDHTGGGADASGLYAAGETLVTFSAVDEYGNASTCESRVRVVDATPPALIVPPRLLRVECTGSGGAFAAMSASATDDCSPFIIDNDRTGGSDASGFYPLGVTDVAFTAVDSQGNRADGSTFVEVVDTTAPAVDCPGLVVVECTGDRSATASLRAQAHDPCDPDTPVENDRTAGGADASDGYPLGSTAVLFEAFDSSGNRGECRSVVEVRDTTPPELGCPGEVRATCTGGGEARVSLIAQVGDCCDPNPLVTNDRTGSSADASGSYPLGETRVTFSAVDAAGLAATCETRVIVEDAEPPLLACPSLVESECLGPAGTRVSVQALATDSCDPAPLVLNDRTGGGADAGDLYPPGDTLVRFSASDASGRVATCETLVRVSDTLAPRVFVEADQACLWPPNHRFVRFRLGEELLVHGFDLCADDADLLLEILEVVSNEPVDGSGDGSSAPDVVLRGDELFLRSERSGGGDGRVYTVRIGVADPAGNSAVGEVELRVPHGGQAPAGCKALPRERFVDDDEVLD